MLTVQPSSSAPAPDHQSQEWYAACRGSWTGCICITTVFGLPVAFLSQVHTGSLCQPVLELAWSPSCKMQESSSIGVKLCWTRVVGRLWIRFCPVQFVPKTKRIEQKHCQDCRLALRARSIGISQQQQCWLWLLSSQNRHTLQGCISSQGGILAGRRARVACLQRGWRLPVLRWVQLNNLSKTSIYPVKAVSGFNGSCKEHSDYVKQDNP